MRILSTKAFSALAITIFWVCAAQAQVVSFSGHDDGAPTTGPFTNSNAAQTSFLSAASGFGPTTTYGFEDQALGFNNSLTIPNGTIAIAAPNLGNGFSGISTTTFGNLYGFNTTPGGKNWLGFPTGSATFTFNTPTNSFGAFFTGLQTIFTTLLQITFNDGTSQTFNLPGNAPVNVNGGAQYFGFTDTNSFISVTISNLGIDAWGIDDVSFNAVAAPGPIPGSGLLCYIALAILGLGSAGWKRRRHRSVLA
jgi:hypothetical protein